MHGFSGRALTGAIVVAALVGAGSVALHSRQQPGSARADRQAAGSRPASSRGPAVASGVAVTRADYLAYARASADYTWDHRDEIVARWRETFDPASPFGYRAPGGLLDLAAIYATLFELERTPRYAERTKQVLLTYGDYRSQFPESAAKARPDYGNGVPALPDFFVVMRYLRAYDTLRRLNQLTPAEAAKIEATAAHSIDYVQQTSEWGPMNRTMLRAETLAWAVRAMPGHPNAARWEQQRRVLGDDNWGNWEIEDATIYHGVWLYSLLGYADAIGKTGELFHTPEVYYYAQYFLNLMSPAGTVADFGDANWPQNWQHFMVFFEAAASRLDDPELKWAAQRIAAKFVDLKNPTSAGLGCFLLDAYRWGRDDIAPRAPSALSAEVMEDVQGKKVVFRNGWTPESTYLLHTYRDEGDGGMNFRDYLKDTIPVEEEKMTHGHADENSIAMLMSGGSLLLHDGGYRDYMPSGPFGAYRQDYFHNRMVVRPEKIFMGQKDGEERYSQRGAIPGQGLLDFLRDAGSYRPVRTRKVDFLSVPEFDYARTRLFDDGWGYDADRVIVYVKDPEMFVVFDVLKSRTDEYFTLAGLWHTRKILERGDHWYDTAYDVVGAEKFPDSKRLLVVFPRAHFRIEGVEPQKRHFQDELTIYQAAARHFEPTQTEGLITVLIPHDKSVAPADLARRVSLVETTPDSAGLAVRIEAGSRRILVAAKQDLRLDIARDHRRPRYVYEKGRVGYGNVETDGDLVFVAEDGNRLTYAIVNMTRAQRGNQVLFQNGQSYHGLPFDASNDFGGVDKVRYWRDTVTIDARSK
jgi:hypothetical protein